VYDFLEDDDDFEEFEFAAEEGYAENEDAVMAGDDGTDKKLWQEDWDDEEVDEDFAR